MKKKRTITKKPLRPFNAELFAQYKKMAEDSEVRSGFKKGSV